MKVADVLNADKTDLQQGKWTDEKPKKSDFPMSKLRGQRFPLTRKWRWCVITFDAAEKKFVIMAAYHKHLPEYKAVLAERIGEDTRTLLRYEYHANHPVVGWHVHTNCGDVTGLELGSTKPNGQERIPSVHKFHRRSSYAGGIDSMDDTLAFEIAAQQFRLPVTPDLFRTPN